MSRSHNHATGQPRSTEWLRFYLPYWLLSVAWHAVVLAGLGLWMLPEVGPGSSLGLITSNTDTHGNQLDGSSYEPQEHGERSRPPDFACFEDPPSVDFSVEIAPEQVQETLTLAGRMPDSYFESPNQLLNSRESLERQDSKESNRTRGRLASDPFRLRQKPRKILALLNAGGTRESEIAVEIALQWLADHQAADGSWSFDHRTERCGKWCRRSGSFGNARIAATALALLPFLGAGETEHDAKHVQPVRRGLTYLIARMEFSGNQGKLMEDQTTMYAHGLATVALCEAYAMTRKPRLKKAAERAIRFIVSVQDPKGGGWRYAPCQPGDTSVLGWQVMALKTAEVAGLDVPGSSLSLARRFLDHVQAQGGATYGYRSPGSSTTTTAIGLLCRLYLGWNRDRGALQRGVSILEQKGPSPLDLYYNYHATQVLRQYGGDAWEEWNLTMRNHLVRTQAAGGHEAGSWLLHDPHASVGGRLYCTAMAALILEVYYRHPLLPSG